MVVRSELLVLKTRTRHGYVDLIYHCIELLLVCAFGFHLSSIRAAPILASNARAWDKKLQKSPLDEIKAVPSPRVSKLKKRNG